MSREELVDLINAFIADQIPEQDHRVPCNFSPAIRSTTAVAVLDHFLGWTVTRGKVQ